MPGDRPKAWFGASVVVGAEDLLGQRLMQLDLAIEPFCSSLKPFGHRGTHCRGAVDALESSVIWYCYTCGLNFWGGNTGG
jgi:hypothetical protein